MSKVYTTWGSVRGCCGHRHKTPETAEACRARDNRACAGFSGNGYSDRAVYVTEANDPYIDGYHTTKHPGKFYLS